MQKIFTLGSDVVLNTHTYSAYVYSSGSPTQSLYHHRKHTHQVRTKITKLKENKMFTSDQFEFTFSMFIHYLILLCFPSLCQFSFLRLSILLSCFL